MPKKIVAQIVQHLRPGGIETMALDLIAGTDDVLISLEGEAKQAIVDWPRLEPFKEQLVFLGKEPGIDLKLVKQLADKFKSSNVSAVHTHHIGPLLYGSLAARLAGIDTIIHTEHDAWHLETRKRRLLQSAIVRFMRPTIIADTSAVADAVSAYLKLPAPKVILNGVDTEIFQRSSQTQARKLFDLPEGVQIVGCAARLEPLKGHRYLLEAMAKLPSDVHLALAGDGSARDDLLSLADDLGILERVHFLGALDQMAKFYNAIDVFCLPSLKEGMPLSPIEAQACGRPAIVTDVGGSASSVCPDTGILVPPADSSTLKNALMRAIREMPTKDPREFVKRSANLTTTKKAYRSLYAA